MSLKENLVKLGTTNPELRPHIRPLLAKLASSDMLTEEQVDILDKWLRSNSYSFMDVRDLPDDLIDDLKWANHGRVNFSQVHLYLNNTNRDEYDELYGRRRRWAALGKKKAARKGVFVEFQGGLSIKHVEGSTPWGQTISQTAWLDDSKSGARVSRMAIQVARDNADLLMKMESEGPAVGFINEKVYAALGKTPRWYYTQSPD